MCPFNGAVVLLPLLDGEPFPPLHRLRVDPDRERRVLVAELRRGVHGIVADREPFRVGNAGFYTFRERLIGSPLVTEFTTRCADVAETSLAAPEIVTGRGDVARFVRVRSGVSAPARVRIASLGIDAPVSPAGIDLAHGVLVVPPPIRRTGGGRTARRRVRMPARS